MNAALTVKREGEGGRQIVGERRNIDMLFCDCQNMV